jgi:hypothetical protein
LKIDEGPVQAHAGKPCSHCTPSGCGIYNIRPVNPCQQFFCAWRQADTPLIEAMRPDLSGVMVVMDRLTWRDDKVLVAIPVGEDIPEKSLTYLLSLAQLTDMNMLTVQFVQEQQKLTGGSRISAYGSPDFVADMKLRFKDGGLDW